MGIKRAFLKYVGFDTQSDPRVKPYPSTAKQLILLELSGRRDERAGGWRMWKSMPMVMRWVLFRQLPGMKTGR